MCNGETNWQDTLPRNRKISDLLPVLFFLPAERRKRFLYFFLRGWTSYFFLPQSLLNRLRIICLFQGRSQEKALFYFLSPSTCLSMGPLRTDLPNPRGRRDFWQSEKEKSFFPPFSAIYPSENYFSSLSPSVDPSQLYCPPVSTLPALSESHTEKGGGEGKFPFSPSLFPLFRFLLVYPGLLFKTRVSFLFVCLRSRNSPWRKKCDVEAKGFRAEIRGVRASQGGKAAKLE